MRVTQFIKLMVTPTVITYFNKYAPLKLSGSVSKGIAMKTTKPAIYYAFQIIQVAVLVPIAEVLYKGFVHGESIFTSSAFQTCLLLIILVNVLHLRMSVDKKSPSTD